MDAALRRHLPQLTYTAPLGGYFFWVCLPDSMDALQLQEKAGAFRVGFRPGVRFSSQGGMRDCLRLCFAFYEPEEIEQGLMRLRQCLAD
jgi:2-aminoadipate transaminase